MEWLDSKSRCPLCRTDFADEIMKHLMTNENKDSKVYFINRRIVGYFIFLLLCGLSVLLASEAKIVMRLERRSAKTVVKKT